MGRALLGKTDHGVVQGGTRCWKEVRLGLPPRKFKKKKSTETPGKGRLSGDSPPDDAVCEPNK